MPVKKVKVLLIERTFLRKDGPKSPHYEDLFLTLLYL